jgi:hypothetical protein
MLFIDDLANCFISGLAICNRNLWRRQSAPGVQNHTTHSQPQLAFQHDADDAEGGAAQGIGIFGTSGLFVDGPEANEGVDLVRQRHGLRHRAGRYFVRRALRLVVVADGVSHRIIQPFGAGIV